MTGQPVDLVLPRAERVPLDELRERLDDARATPQEPFAETITAFAAELSRALFRSPETAGIPEVQALAFSMRRSEIRRLERDFHGAAPAGTVLVPRGTAFHVPPSNVGTIFVYSWLYSALAGNRNVLRLSAEGGLAEAICTVMGRLLAHEEFAALAPAVTIVRYGHEREITEVLSDAADVRVIWGGDDTVRTIRQVPIPPRAVELTFPDRSSISLLDAAAYLALGAGDREKVAGAFYNDAYWFDQMGCSSPRLVVWRGTADDADAASSDFFTRVHAEVVGHDYRVDTSIAMAKLRFGCEAALDHPVASLRRYGNEVTVARLASLEHLGADHPGAGFFYEARVDALDELVTQVVPRNQTLGHFGVARDDLVGLVRTLGGRGIQRVVPIGAALQFSRFWDGFDLLRAFSQVVEVSDHPTALDVPGAA